MPSNVIASLNQVSQIGVEVTPGEAVAATRRLQSLGLPINPAQNIQEFKPRGSKFATAHAETQRWSEGSIGDGSGVSYNEIQYVFASIFSKTTPDQLLDVGDSTTPVEAYDWVYDIATYARDEVQTYTIETGDALSGRSYRAPYCYFTGCTIASTRSGEVSVSGDLVGHARENFALSDTNIKEASLIPATPAHLNVYADDAPEDLGNTILDGNFTATLGLTDRASQVWFHGRDYQGPAARVETEPSATCELVQADGEEVDDILLGLDTGQRKFFRFEWVGPAIGNTGYNFSLIWDIAAQVGDAASYDDEDGVHSATIPMVAEHDGNWGRAMSAKVRNDIPTLD